MQCRIICFAEYRCTECRYADLCAECRYDECCYAGCRSAMFSAVSEAVMKQMYDMQVQPHLILGFLGFCTVS